MMIMMMMMMVRMMTNRSMALVVVGETWLTFTLIFGVAFLPGQQAASTENFRRPVVIPLKEDPYAKLDHDPSLGCQLGGNFYELDEVFHPNMEEPHGILHCVQCKCIAEHKKRRVTGRIACKRFIDLCPKPQCDNPVLLPNQCCKSCPNEAPFEPQLFGNNNGDTSDYTFDAGYHEFMALMTGRFRRPSVMTTGVGRAYATLEKRNLHFSIYFDKLEEVPTAVLFVDKNHDVLFEKTFNGPTGHKICGVWSNIPRMFLKALRRGEIMALLATKKQPEGVIGGSLIKPKILSREVFSSLLFPSTTQTVQNSGYGGAAVVDIQGTGNELTVSIWLNAATVIDPGSSKYVLISLEKDDGRRKQIKVLRADLHNRDNLFAAEVRMTLAPAEQRWLSKGKLLLVVSCDFLSPSELVGLLVPKQSCDVYQAVLTEDTESSRSVPNGTAGYAILEVAEDGVFKYSMRTAGERRTTLSGFAIEKEARRNRRRIALQTRENVRFNDGRSHGIIADHIHVRELELLYKEKLYFTAFDAEGGAALRGVIRRLVHNNAVELNAAPMVLSGQGVRPRPVRTVAGAVAWFSDPSDECVLSYTVSVARTPGLSAADVKLSLCHWQSSSADGCFAQLTKFQFVNIDLSDSTIVGSIDQLSSQSWRMLTLDGAYVKLQTPFYEHLTGYFSVLNDRCWRRQVQRDLVVAEDQESYQRETRTDCEYEQFRYGDGDSWHALHISCSMCSCQRGQVKCEPVLCPNLTCSNPVRLPGHCCQSCPVDTSSPLAFGQGCFWPSDRKWHSHGSVWHPYLPPLGFSRCALCQCPINATEVVCSKTSCPQLTCLPKLRYREKPDDCCLKCRPEPPTTTTTMAPKKRISVLGDEGSSGKCVFNNETYAEGARFTPKLLHLSISKCVVCKCQRSRVTCDKNSCT